MLPKNIRKSFGVNWSPIFNLMQSDPGLNIKDCENIDSNLA